MVTLLITGCQSMVTQTAQYLPGGPRYSSQPLTSTRKLRSSSTLIGEKTESYPFTRLFRCCIVLPAKSSIFRSKKNSNPTSLINSLQYENVLSLVILGKVTLVFDHHWVSGYHRTFLYFWLQSFILQSVTSNNGLVTCQTLTCSLLYSAAFCILNLLVNYFVLKNQKPSFKKTYKKVGCSYQSCFYAHFFFLCCKHLKLQWRARCRKQQQREAQFLPEPNVR